VRGGHCRLRYGTCNFTHTPAVFVRVPRCAFVSRLARKRRLQRPQRNTASPLLSAPPCKRLWPPAPKDDVASHFLGRCVCEPHSRRAPLPPWGRHRASRARSATTRCCSTMCRARTAHRERGGAHGCVARAHTRQQTTQTHERGALATFLTPFRAPHATRRVLPLRPSTTCRPTRRYIAAGRADKWQGACGIDGFCSCASASQSASPALRRTCSSTALRSSRRVLPSLRGRPALSSPFSGISALTTFVLRAEWRSTVGASR
jgi:hypothetical protein